MTKKGKTIHLKRELSPMFWPIQRKKFTWTVKPKSGPHPTQQCFPLLIIIRDILKLAETRKEAKKIVAQGKIIVDGKIRRDIRYPVGFMDVVTIPDIKKQFRVLASKKGLFLNEVNEDEIDFKLCRIEDKKSLKNGHVELNLHDGRNIVVKVNDAHNPEEDIYKTLDVIKISIPDQDILEHIKLEEGKLAFLIDGNNIGKYGSITSIVKQTRQKRRNFLVTISSEQGREYQTILKYAFAIGDKSPRVSISFMED